MSIRSFSRSSVLRAGLACMALLVLIAATWRWKLIASATRFTTFGTDDLFAYFYPMMEVGAAKLRSGSLFLWNPHQAGGMPGLATLQLGIFYPLHAVYLFLPTATAMAVSVLLHVALAAAGMLVLCRILGLGWLAAVTGAAFYSITQVMAQFHWPSGMEAQAWLPIGVAALERLVLRSDRRWMPVLTAAVAMPVLAGGYQTSVDLYYCYALFACAGLARRLAGEPAARNWLPGVLVSLVCAAAGGVLLCAPQLLPTMELSRFSPRSAEALQASQLYIFGNIWEALPVLLRALFVPPHGFRDLELFVGVAATALATAGLVRARSMAVPLILLCAFGVLSLNAPSWFLDVRSALPVLGWFRVPMREFLMTKFAVSLLLAFGIESFARPDRSVAGRLPATVLLFAGLAVALALTPKRDEATTTVAAGLAAAAAACLFLRNPALRAAAAIAMIGLLAFDTLARPVNVLAVPYAHEKWRIVYDDEALFHAVANQAQLDRAYVLDSRPGLTVKHAMLFGTYTPSDYDPLAPAYFGDCVRRARFDPQAWGPPPPEDPSVGFFPDPVDIIKGPAKRCLDLLSVRFTALPQIALMDQEVTGAWARQAGKLPLVVGDPTPYFLFRNPKAVPRAFGVYSAECHGPTGAELDRVLDPAFDPLRSVVLDAGPDCPASNPNPDDGSEPTVRITRYADTSIDVVGDFARPGFLVLTDSFYPGWRATVNGQEARILRANAMYRAVPVPAGTVSISFRYRPASLYAGFALAPLGLVFFVFGWRRLGRTPRRAVTAR